jgi:hypothetical protein
LQQKSILDELLGVGRKRRLAGAGGFRSHLEFAGMAPFQEVIQIAVKASQFRSPRRPLGPAAAGLVARAAATG